MDFGVLTRHGQDIESQSPGVLIQNPIYANEILTMGSRRPSLAATRHAWSSGSSGYAGAVDESRRPSVSEVSDVSDRDLDYASEWYGGGAGGVHLSSEGKPKRLFGSLTFGPLAIGNVIDEEKNGDGDGFMAFEEECASMGSSEKVSGPPTRMTFGSGRTVLSSPSHQSIPPNDARPTGAGGRDAHPTEPPASLFGDYTWGRNQLVSKPRQLQSALGIVSEVGPLDDHMHQTRTAPHVASRVLLGPSTATTDLEPESERITTRRGFEDLNVDSASPFQ